MENKNDRRHIVSEIIGRFFDGSYTAQIEMRFFDWLADERDSAMKESYIKCVWDRIGAGIVREDRKELARFKRRLGIKSRIGELNRIVRYAAAVLIPPFIVMGAWLLYVDSDSRLSGNGVEMPVGIQHEKIVRIVAPEKGDGVAILPDSSTVCLTEGSCILYSENIFVEERHVKLMGECRFSVIHNEGRPFVVSTGNIDVTVLGTEFSVRDIAGSDVIVTLYSGSVKVDFGGGGRSVVLVEGETLKFDPETGASMVATASKTKASPKVTAVPGAEIVPDAETVLNIETAPGTETVSEGDEFIERTTISVIVSEDGELSNTIGDLDCEEMSIPDIAAAIKDHYGFIIEIDSLAAPEGRYSVNFSGGEHLSRIMSVMSMMADFEYTIGDDGREARITAKR